jgi:hypothetical protein
MPHAAFETKGGILMLSTPRPKGPADEGSTPSGVPGPHELGASRKEALWAIAAVVLFALIVASFWFEASH